MRTGVHEPPVASTCSLPVLENANQGGPQARKRGCCSAADAADARRVADQLGIPFYAVDFEHEFDRIMDYFVDEYTRGRTPNPCVMCNNWLKFGRLGDYAHQIGADYIATGHYARVVACDLETTGDSAPRPPGKRFRLQRAIDPAKDQSYVLYGISREILPRLLFPVGDLSKAEVRQHARLLDLRVADKPDSQEICFVPTHDYHAFIRSRRPDFDGTGDIVDRDGNVLGHHDGFEAYTIGQRKGLGMAFGERRYVVKIDSDSHQVMIGTRAELLGGVLTAGRMNWLIEPPADTFRCEAKIRYLHSAAAATVTMCPGDRVHVEFDDPQSAITPGQAVVFYDGDTVLGGGIIDEAA